MVYFLPKIPIWIIFRVFQWKYIYFMAIWSILRQFVIPIWWYTFWYTIWYTFWSFGIFIPFWYLVSWKIWQPCLELQNM
jgi:hypothetical protein